MLGLCKGFRVFGNQKKLFVFLKLRPKMLPWRVYFQIPGNPPFSLARVRKEVQSREFVNDIRNLIFTTGKALIPWILHRYVVAYLYMILLGVRGKHLRCESWHVHETGVCSVNGFMLHHVIGVLLLRGFWVSKKTCIKNVVCFEPRNWRLHGCGAWVFCWCHTLPKSRDWLVYCWEIC